MASEFPQYVVPNAKDMLSLGCGQPSPAILKSSMEIIPKNYLEDAPFELLQYGDIRGFVSYRKMIYHMLKHCTKTILDESDIQNSIFMTNGISQALLLIASLYRKKTTVIYAENPTYFIALSIFKNMGYEVRPFEMKNLNELKRQLYLDDPYGNKQYLMYIIPFHQNPTGRNIHYSELEQLLEICNIHTGLRVLSDETYQLLSFDDDSHTHPSSLATSHRNIVSMGTFSKIIAPALRCGWIFSRDTEFLKELESCGFMDSGGGVNPINGRMITQIFESSQIHYGSYMKVFIDNLVSIKKFLRRNYEILETALLKYPDYFQFERSTGGYFIWVKSLKMPAKDLLDIAVKHKIRFHTGDKFSPDGSCTEYFRLSCSFYVEDDWEFFESRLDKIISEIENKTDIILVHMIGHKGKLGRLICNEITESSNKKLGVTINRDIDLTGIGTTKREVIVDVSSPEGTAGLLSKLLEKHIYVPVVIGTTGDLPLHLIAEYKKHAKVELSPNFSIGITRIVKMLSDLEKDYWSGNIKDIHHERKKDAPSGTAKHLAHELGKSKIIVHESNIVSERTGDVIGYHEITLDAPYERITVTHEAKDRRLFAVGCLNLIDSMFKH
uniref:Aminotransferase class I/classII domain-containing protein n=1 Tax=viral metagenome TaxID=1070528 RepID=A0A6C0EDI8_9ZZZZ